MFTKEVVLDIDMFNALMKRRIFGEVDGSIIVAEDGSGTGWCEAYAGEKHSQPDCLLSALISHSVFCLTRR